MQDRDSHTMSATEQDLPGLAAPGPETVEIGSRDLAAVCAKVKTESRYVFRLDYLKTGRCRLTILPLPRAAQSSPVE